MLILFRRSRHMDQVVLKAMTIKSNAAGARHQRTRLLRWQLLAARPHGIFLSPIPRVAPSLEIGFRPLRKESLPRGLEIGASLVEGRGGS